MKVLIIDDDKFIQTVYESELHQENIEVFLANDGVEGLELAKKEKPDVILLDLIMPHMDGFIFLRECKKAPKLKKIPVIVSTALEQQRDIDEVMGLGALKYLPKDQYSPNQVIEEIKKTLLGEG